MQYEFESIYFVLSNQEASSGLFRASTSFQKEFHAKKTALLDLLNF